MKIQNSQFVKLVIRTMMTVKTKIKLCNLFFKIVCNIIIFN